MQSSSTAGLKSISWLHAARRLQHIGLVLARHGFGEIVDRLGLYVPRLPGAAPAPSTRERLALRLVEVLTDLGPTYLKLGQLLATRADLLPADVVQALSRLHANVRPLAFAEIARVIDQELGRPHRQAFLSVDANCLAAASIGQVHRARLHDGVEVVIKVQRPGLRKQVEADLTIMRLLAQLLAQRVPEVAAYQPLTLVDAFARSIRMELDFRSEAANATRLRVLLGDAPEVHVPQVYPQWTSERMLVMEYVVGARLLELPAPARSDARQALLRAFVRQMMEHGVFHADPHPGNLLALPDGRVVLLDLGTIDVLDEPLRAGLFRLGFALVLKRTRALCREVIGLAQLEDAARVDHVRLERELAELVQAASGGQGGAQGSVLVGKMLSMSRSHALRLPASLLALMRTLAILDGVLRSLDPARDLVRDLRREIAWAAGRNLRRQVRQGLSGLLTQGAQRMRAVLARLSRSARRVE